MSQISDNQSQFDEQIERYKDQKPDVKTILQEEKDDIIEVLYESPGEAIEYEEVLVDNSVVLEEPSMICDFCGYSNTDKFYFRLHMQSHRTPEDQKVKSRKKPTAYCSICDRFFSTARIKNDHDKTIHSIGPQFHCNIENCNESFTNREKLQIHKQQHRSELYQCEYDGCNKSFSSISLFTKHKVHHEKPHKCKKCPKQFASSYKLQVHKKTVHLKILENCPHCNKTFSHKSSLKEHIFIRHMDFRFSCEYPDCNGKTFAKKHHYIRHFKKFHTKLANYEEELQRILQLKNHHL